MKKLIYYIAAIMSIVFISCNEEIETSSYKQGEAVVSSFAPASGTVGTEIAITGENLQQISKAYIDDLEVNIKTRVNDKHITIEANENGRTGVIKLKTSDGDSVVSNEVFTYNYPTPTLTALPTTFEAGASVLLTGTNLDAVQEIWFVLVETKSTADRVKVEEFTKLQTELLFKVPNIKKGTVKVELSYFNGTESVQTESEDVVLENDGVIVDTDMSGIYKMGAEVVLEGSGFATVSKVLLGGVEQNLVEATPTQITFRLADNSKFVDGDNTAVLSFVSGETDPIVIKEDFKFNINSFYKRTNCSLTGRDKGDVFFSFRNGRSYAKTQTEALDPVAFGFNPKFKVCSAPNVLLPAITDEQYYSVEPYLYMYVLGSTAAIAGPTSTTNRMGQLVTGYVYGTPTVVMFTLNPENANEKVFIDKINGGTFTSADFDIEALKAIEVQGRSTSGTLSPRNDEDILGYAPAAPSSTKVAYSADPETVVLVMHMKPNRSDWSFSMDNVVKFGFMNITNLTYVEGAAYEAGITFDIYWQRTPIK